MTTALFSFVLLVSLAVTHCFINNYDQPFDFNCQQGEIINYIHSINSNEYNDRIFDFGCRSLSCYESCYKSDYVNDFDQPINFTCPGTKVLVGIESYHDDSPEDRRYKFNCCDVSSQPLSDLYTTDYLNDWDGEIKFSVPENYAIKSLYSVHENTFEDRRWKLQLGML
ncbi:hypothetical protein Btru_017237 [Bulinus truncatus]|nr:hypothetical protein Btru_017237 [Bulinus truncatus]